MLLKNKRVAIIGAGPVGLTMARLLQQKGIAVTVYERDKDAHTRISGGTLDLHKGSGQDALEKAGLLQTYYAMARGMGRTVTDEHANVLFTKRPGHSEYYDNPEINRNDLRKMLLESLTDGTVVWNRKFTGLKQSNLPAGQASGQWLLHFETDSDSYKEEVTADVVIGANGGMSKARTYVTDAAIEYTGTIILQGEVAQPEISCPEFYQLCNDNILMIAANGHSLVANPSNGNVLSYSVIFKKPEEWIDERGNFTDTESIHTFLANRFAEWDECYKQLFRASSSFVVWPTRKIPMDTSWKTNRSLPITLIGDAAHIMPPFAGQGVNIGLLDALILSDNLTNGKYETIAAAISDYEQKMFVYATEAQGETSANEIAMSLPDFSFLNFYL